MTNANKPDKLRIVFDCAAEYAGTSLNKEVLQGPDLTNRLLGVLMRFREDQVALMGDIEAMFHQVKVSPEDRDALRFLWWKGGDVSQQPEVYRMTYISLVVSGAPAVPALRLSAPPKIIRRSSNKRQYRPSWRNFMLTTARIRGH